ncbi:hypothetical protein BX070DRAFT_229320 [Coemansia spiralis]|nr:hypothetical protein BX070DRAFT_229320 [Coemansia spiralis]
MELRNRKLSEENVEETEQNIKQEMGNSNEQSNLPKSLESVPGSAKMHLELAVDSTAMDVEAVVKEATEAMDIADEDADTRSDSNITDDGDDNMGNDELGSVSGGFLGDFEEIEEDEDVERFISLNHTPLPSARQSPAPLVLPQNNNPSAQQPIPDFESIPEASAHTVALRTGDGQPLTDTAYSDIGESNELVQTTVKEPTSPLSSGNNNTAGQQFREKFIPKLSTDMFFTESTLTNSSEAPASVCASVKPAAVLQKPSSLRRNNSINSPAVQKPMEGKDNLPAVANDSMAEVLQNTANNQSVSRPQSPSPQTDKDDDVVETLLGQPMPQQQQQQPTQQQQPKVQKSSQQALAAIEGGGIVEAPKSPVTKGELAAKLPNGYSVEHAHFLALAQKAKSGSLNNKETIDYQRLRAKAHEKALPQTAHERLVEGSAKALEQYPHIASGYIPLLYKETLLQRGTCYHTQMPKLDGASVEGIVSPAANPWDYAQSNGKFSRRMGMPVSQDLVALELARLAHADVVSYMRDVVIPFKVISDDSNLAKDSDTPAHSILLVDKPLLSMQASTPRKHNQIFYEASVCNKLLGGGSMANATTELSNSMHENEFSSDNANYTLYGVHGFFAGDNAGKARAPVTTTLEGKSVEAAIASASANGEDGAGIGRESERLSWWIPSEVWVSHVDVQRSGIVRVTRHTCGDLGGGSSSGTQPSTRDLNRQPRPLERQPEDTSVSAQQRTNAAMMNLEAELRTSLVADLTQLDIEGDYVPIPFTYAPADLAEFSAGGIKGNISNSSTNNSARNRRRAANKRKKAKKVATAAANP